MKHPARVPARALASALAFGICAATADAQGSRYIRLAVGAARLGAPSPAFPLSTVIHPAVALGYASAGGHALELRASRLDVETTQRLAPGQTSEAPYTVRVRATPVELANSYELSVGRVRPRAGVGAVRTDVVDGRGSDTPMEYTRSTRYGGVALLGAATRLGGATTAVVRAGYYYASDPPRSEGLRVGLSGYRVDAGLELAF